MNKNIFSICFCFSVAILNAQSPILTATNSNPQVGDSFTGNDIPYTNPGAAGANQTWNFSSLVSSGTQTFSFLNSATTTNAATFPNATLATFNPSNSYYNYFSASSSALSTEGYVYGPPTNLIIPYSNPQMVLSYPFTMGSTFVDAYYGTYTSGTNTINRTGVDTVTADGYGTLILPNGTYTNVLRVLVIDNYADTTSLGAPYALFTFTTYNWYLPGTHYQILSLTTLNSNGGPPLAQFGTYLDVPTMSIANTNFSDGDFKLFPNPSNGKLFFKTDETIRSLVCINYLGQPIELKMENGVIDVSALSKGIYILNVTYENGESCIAKFIRE